MIKHVRYFLSPIVLALAILCIFMGSYSSLIFIIAFALSVFFGDMLLSQDREPFENPNPFLLNLSLYINLPLLYILSFLALFMVTDLNPQWMIWLYRYFGIEIMDAKANLVQGDKLGLLLYTVPLFIATMGTNVGHELTHRKRKRFDMMVGNWLLALSWDCTFAIEHVYGHHKNVGYDDDPATASRNESLYLFILRGTIKAHKDAWKIEIGRLKRISKFPFTFSNKMIKGYLRSLAIYIAAYCVGGIPGMLIFVFWSVLAKVYLETINFVEHYGLVREVGQPVLPKHSWNSNHIISSSLLYNLNRHSAHHEKANLRYWELEAYPDAPTLPQGYLACLYLAFLFPPLFKRIMKPHLKKWDETYASEGERKILGY